MEIIIGKTSGFCGGVINAVKKAEKELDKRNKPLFCLGEIVHNDIVVKKLEEKGLTTINDISESSGDTIIRAHGVSKDIYKQAEENNITLIDLTCPKVLKIHDYAEKYANMGYYIFLIGDRAHPEIIGTISFCGKNSCVIQNIDEVEEALSIFEKSKIKNLLVISQTTYSVKKFNEIINKIKENIDKDINLKVSNTICNATNIRQVETEKLSKEVELMIIIGGKNSSNTKKLYDIAKSNCKNTCMIQTEKDIDLEYVKIFNKIGIMAGASTPEEVIKEVYNKIK